MIATAHELLVKVRSPNFCIYLANRKIPTLLLDDSVKREAVERFLGIAKCLVISTRCFHKVDRFQGIPKGCIVVKTKGVEIGTQSSRDLKKKVIDKEENK